MTNRYKEYHHEDYFKYERKDGSHELYHSIVSKRMNYMEKIVIEQWNDRKRKWVHLSQSNTLLVKCLHAKVLTKEEAEAELFLTRL